MKRIHNENLFHVMKHCSLNLCLNHKFINILESKLQKRVKILESANEFVYISIKKQIKCKTLRKLRTSKL